MYAIEELQSANREILGGNLIYGYTRFPNKEFEKIDNTFYFF